MAESIPVSGQGMADIAVAITGVALTWDLARDLAHVIAGRHHEDPMLISWFDKTTGKFSPSCCKCEIKGGAAWEVYGKNHGGRHRVSINSDTYVFIYS